MEFGYWITNGTQAPFYARRAFCLREGIQSATINVTGLGQFNLYLNGEKVSEDLLEPGWTDYHKTVQYVTYDVTRMLHSGQNVIGIETGNGWFIMDAQEGHGYTFRNPSFMPPDPNPYKPFGPYLMAMASLQIQYADGSEQTILSDAEWKTHPHAVVWTNVYGSEHLDGSRLPGPETSWANVGFCDVDWEHARLVPAEDMPKGKLCPRTQPPIRVIQEYRASQGMDADGLCVYDLGQNITGILSAQVKGKAGTLVSFFPAEKLDANGRPDQMAKNWMLIDNVISYRIAQDDVWESFSQVFTCFSGRYIGVSGNAEVRNLRGAAITSAWQRAGTFICDDERYALIYRMIERTVEANMLSVHMDCPTIERFAWQETNHLMAPAIMYMKDGSRLWRKFLADCRDAQHTADDRFLDRDGYLFCPGNGLIPSQAPCYIRNVLPIPGVGSFYDTIAWGSTIILGTHWHYQFYGDVSVITENYEAGIKYFRYLLTCLDPNGFISHGLGDWGNPEGEYARENIETALLYADAVTLASFAEILGKQEDYVWLRAKAEEIREHYNKVLLVQDDCGRWCYRSYERREEGIVTTQACEALPLYWKMVPEEKRKDVAESLREALEKRGALIAGETGLPYVIQAAAQNGMNDLIAAYITRESHPSYYAFVLAGETTLGEYWEENPRSHCHDMMGHIIEWYYRNVAGIQSLAPGFAKVRIHPWLPEGMNRLICTYQTPHGPISVEAYRYENGVKVERKVPSGIELME